MEECQICNVCKGKHKIQIQGICGDHAEKIKKMLEWFDKVQKKEQKEEKK